MQVGAGRRRAPWSPDHCPTREERRVCDPTGSSYFVCLLCVFFCLLFYFPFLLMEAEMGNHCLVTSVLKNKG